MLYIVCVRERRERESGVKKSEKPFGTQSGYFCVFTCTRLYFHMPTTCLRIDRFSDLPAIGIERESVCKCPEGDMG